MRIKSYFATSVASAMQRARGELGPDAMLMNSRKASADCSHLGEYEVIFALPAPVSGPDAQAPKPSDFHDLFAERVGRPRLENTPKEDLPALIAKHIRTDPVLSRIVVLIGPPGCGKTTTLIKLALREGLFARKSVQVLNLDVDRVGSGYRLHALANAAGLDCRSLATEAALDLALDEYRSKDLILIDTPAYDTSNLAQAATLSRIVRQRPGTQTHLVLEAYRSGTERRFVLDRFNVFCIDRLIYSKMDEAANRLAVLDSLIDTATPLSFFTNGQQVPEDIQVADPELMATWVHSNAGTQSAAMAA